MRVVPASPECVHRRALRWCQEVLDKSADFIFDPHPEIVIPVGFTNRKVLGESFDVKEAGKSVPAGFIANAADIGRVAVFLASDDSRYIIGQTIICDGGQTSILQLTGDFRERRKERWGANYVGEK